MIRCAQYCPVAKALEMLAERSTLLVVRELLMGRRRFNELKRGLPLIAPSVLSQRLKSLKAHHIVVRRVQPSESTYIPTPAGEERRPSSASPELGDSAGRGAGWPCRISMQAS